MKVQAICTVCGAPASKTYRKVEKNIQEQVVVGETELYEARCRLHTDYFEERDQLDFLSPDSAAENAQLL